MQLAKTSRTYRNNGYSFEVVKYIQENPSFEILWAGNHFNPSSVPEHVVKREELIQIITEMSETN